jgi:hypothetical protein
VPRAACVTVETDGLLETQFDLPPTQRAGIRLYADQRMSRDVTPQGFTAARGSMAVIAQTPGEVMLEPQRLPWWNVDAQRWEVASSRAERCGSRPAASRPRCRPASGRGCAATAPHTGWR